MIQTGIQMIQTRFKENPKGTLPRQESPGNPEGTPWEPRENL